MSLSGQDSAERSMSLLTDNRTEFCGMPIKVKVKVNLDICNAPLILYHFPKRSDMATRSFNCRQAIPAFTSQPQSITALWLVLILPTHGG